LRKCLSIVLATATVAVLLPMSSSAVASAPSIHVTKRAPNVRCMRLDRAESKLRRLGFHIRERGGGVFGIIIKRDWVVVHESQKGNTVTLTAGRFC
jgi:hypothetical protein